MTKVFRNNMSNGSKKRISSIFCKVYLNATQYQCYQSTNTKNTRFCSHKLQCSKSSFSNNCI